MMDGSRPHGEAACDQVMGAKAQAAGRRLAVGTRGAGPRVVRTHRLVARA
jgi:hypothetical protein